MNFNIVYKVKRITPCLLLLMVGVNTAVLIYRYRAFRRCQTRAPAEGFCVSGLLVPLVDILPKGIVVAEYAANNPNTAVTIRGKNKIINHTVRMDNIYSGCIIFNDFNERFN